MWRKYMDYFDEIISGKGESYFIFHMQWFLFCSQAQQSTSVETELRKVRISAKFKIIEKSEVSDSSRLIHNDKSSPFKNSFYKNKRFFSDCLFALKRTF